jgi:hypothetical protein
MEVTASGQDVHGSPEHRTPEHLTWQQDDGAKIRVVIRGVSHQPGTPSKKRTSCSEEGAEEERSIRRKIDDDDDDDADDDGPDAGKNSSKRKRVSKVEGSATRNPQPATRKPLDVRADAPLAVIGYMNSRAFTKVCMRIETDDLARFRNARIAAEKKLMKPVRIVRLQYHEDHPEVRQYLKEALNLAEQPDGGLAFRNPDAELQSVTTLRALMAKDETSIDKFFYARQIVWKDANAAGGERIEDLKGPRKFRTLDTVIDLYIRAT